MNSNKRNRYNKMYDGNRDSVDPKDLNPIQESEVETELEVQPQEDKTAWTDETSFLPTAEQLRETVGIVVANKLNVRKLPNKHSAVVCILDKDTKVLINNDQSTNDFYKVSFASEAVTIIEGYCMKEFITIP